MNTINVIEIYKFTNLWVFDDDKKGLEREALIAGADLIIDNMVSTFENPEDGFICIFSENPFPGHMYKLELTQRGDLINGNWYRCAALGLDGWLCGSLYKYFDTEPENIYIQVKEKK